MFDQEFIDRIAEAVAQRIAAKAEALAQTVAVKAKADELWTATEVAEHLGYSRRHVVDRLSKNPNFPAPIVVPTKTGEGCRKLWHRERIISWDGQKTRRAA